MNGMSSIVKSITRLVTGFITIFGIYIILYGHVTPGGGFAGGVILACAFILLTLAFGKGFSLGIMSRKEASTWDSIGAALFLLFAVLGLVFTQMFFQNFIDPAKPFHPWKGGGTILYNNIFIGIKVSACLFGVFIALILFRRGPAEPEEEEI